MHTEQPDQQPEHQQRRPPPQWRGRAVDVWVRRTTVEGPARKVLVDHSAAAELVIVGARRRQDHFGLQLGRVAHTLLHHAQCPVAVVPQHV